MKALVDPIAWAWFGLLATAVVLLVRHRRKWSGFLLLLATTASAFQLARIPDRLVAKLERPYLPGSTIATADVVLVLGGFGSVSKHSYTGFEFHDSADRLITGAALVRGGKAAALVISGGGRGEPPQPVDAEAAASWLNRWQMVTNKVVILPVCRNTREEALRFSAMAKENGWKRVLLVTSAWHLRRAEWTFKSGTIEVIPVGCDFQGVPALEESLKFWSFIPRTETLTRLNLWLQEEVGFLYYKLRG